MMNEKLRIKNNQDFRDNPPGEGRSDLRNQILYIECNVRTTFRVTRPDDNNEI